MSGIRKEKHVFLKNQESMIQLENQEKVSLLCGDDKKDLGLISSNEEYEGQIGNFKKELERLLDNHKILVKAKETLLHEKDVKLENLTAQIASLQALHNLKIKQAAQMEELEKELGIIRRLNSEKLYSVRYKHKLEKSALESHHESNVTKVIENSKKNARIHIEEELLQVFQANKKLKSDLLCLMKKHASLEKQRSRLQWAKLNLCLSHS